MLAVRAPLVWTVQEVSCKIGTCIVNGFTVCRVAWLQWLGDFSQGLVMSVSLCTTLSIALPVKPVSRFATLSFIIRPPPEWVLVVQLVQPSGVAVGGWFVKFFKADCDYNKWLFSDWVQVYDDHIVSLQCVCVTKRPSVFNLCAQRLNLSKFSDLELWLCL